MRSQLQRTFSPHSRRRIAVLTILATAPLMMIAGFPVQTVGASFTDETSFSNSSVSTATLAPLSDVTARRDASGIAHVSWTPPTSRTDVDLSYQVKRTIAGSTQTISPTVSEGGFSDDITAMPQFAEKQVTAISAGTNHTCAIADGAAYCWGKNDVGQLGVGQSQGSTHQPQEVYAGGVLSGKTVTAIDSGSSHTCVIADGQPYCWGFNLNGQLGDGEYGPGTNRFRPVAVDPEGALQGKTLTVISASTRATCVIADGQPYCWGSNSTNLMGNGGNYNQSQPQPRLVDHPWLTSRTITQISVGLGHACVRATDGNAYCWGDNLFGQIGIGPSYLGGFVSVAQVRSTSTPTVTYLTDVRSIDAGDVSTCAYARLSANDPLGYYCWGLLMETASPSYTSYSLPTPVNVSGATGLATAPRILTIGEYVTCGVGQTLNTEAYCWGEGTSGELGNRIAQDSPLPVPVNFSSNSGSITDLAIGLKHVCAIKGGAVYCWGTEHNGALGVDGSQNLTPKPVTLGDGLGNPYCDTNWVLTSSGRCAPGSNVAVSYEIGYSMRGWTAPSTSQVTATWGSTP